MRGFSAVWTQGSRKRKERAIYNREEAEEHRRLHHAHSILYFLFKKENSVSGVGQKGRKALAIAPKKEVMGEKEIGASFYEERGAYNGFEFDPKQASLWYRKRVLWLCLNYLLACAPDR